MQSRIEHVKQQIRQAELAGGRTPGSVQLVAVSKSHNRDAIRQAYQIGLRDFAENYWQEAQSKMQALADLDIHWHFIGPIQSNKTKSIAQHFHWVHTVTRSKIAALLDAARPNHLPPLNICLQVNLDAEATKQGVSLDEIGALITSLSPLKRLQLRGLMMIPKPLEDEEAQYQSFLRLTTLQHTLNTRYHLTLDCLSMGMSHDYPAAIRAGSTLVRLGSAIFGERPVQGVYHDH